MSQCDGCPQGGRRKQRQCIRVGIGHSRPLGPQWEKTQPSRVSQACHRLRPTLAMPPFGPLIIRVILSWVLKDE